MAKVRCKLCGKELESINRRDFKTCGCPNKTFVTGDSTCFQVGGEDLSKIELIESTKKKEVLGSFSSEDIQFMEERRKRKVSRKLLDSVEIR